MLVEIRVLLTGKTTKVPKHHADTFVAKGIAEFVSMPAEVPSTPEVKVAANPVSLAPAQDYNAMTVERLRELATERGLQFHPQLGKDRLIKLLKG